MSDAAAAIVIYHNPACGTSRNVLALLRQRGCEPKIVEYLKTPLTKKQLAELVQTIKVPVRDILRRKGTPYEELNLDDPKWKDAELLDFITQHPILLNRPIVVTKKGAKLCRPPETVMELL